MDTGIFMKKVFDAIRTYPGNITKTKKTINNWRTEISSLFGLIEYDSQSNEAWPGSMSKTLAENQDLVEFFSGPGRGVFGAEVIEDQQRGLSDGLEPLIVGDFTGGTKGRA